MIKRIASPTDFSPEGQSAFAHALRLALLHRCRLDLLHVHGRGEKDAFGRFPHVREVLQRWGALRSGAAVDDITAETGVTVAKVEIRDNDAVGGLTTFLYGHAPDLVVMASHGRDGLQRWLGGSVSSGVAQQTHVPTLVLGPGSRPFVDAATGALSVGRVVVPVARDPAPQAAIDRLAQLTEGLGCAFEFLHVGHAPPLIHDTAGGPVEVQQIEGAVVGGILAAAEGASLIAMPTDGRRGLMDQLTGSTTEQVLARAPCPVLVLPVRG